MERFTLAIINLKSGRQLSKKKQKKKEKKSRRYIRSITMDFVVDVVNKDSCNLRDK